MIRSKKKQLLLLKKSISIYIYILHIVYYIAYTHYIPIGWYNYLLFVLALLQQNVY